MFLTFPRILSSLVSALYVFDDSSRLSQNTVGFARYHHPTRRQFSFLIRIIFPFISFFFYCRLKNKVETFPKSAYARENKRRDRRNKIIPPSNGNTRPCIILRLQLYYLFLLSFRIPSGTSSMEKCEFLLSVPHLRISKKYYALCHSIPPPSSAARFNGTDKYKYYTVRQI